LVGYWSDEAFLEGYYGDEFFFCSILRSFFRIRHNKRRLSSMTYATAEKRRGLIFLLCDLFKTNILSRDELYDEFRVDAAAQRRRDVVFL
jgi:hypothetical protein